MKLQYFKDEPELEQKYSREDVVSWLKTFLRENGIDKKKYQDKYIKRNTDKRNIATLNFSSISNKTFSRTYGALIVLLSQCKRSYLKHGTNGTIKIVIFSPNEEFKVCEEIVNLIKDNIKFTVE